MAIFHCTISNISRKKGSSVCATAAYITGERIFETRTGQTYNYGRKQRIDFYEVMLPEGVPEEYKAVSTLSNLIENYEQADNARPGKKEEFALPREATRDQKIAIAQKHITECYTSKGYPCIWALHDIDGENPHCHVIIINRRINDRGDFEKQKTKTIYDRDEDGNKIPVYETMRDDAGKILKDKNGKRILKVDATGQPIQSRDRNGKLLYKRIKVETSYLDEKDLVKVVRKNCEQCINEVLPADRKVDCRSLAEQGIDRTPTVHEGYAARGMEARGEVSERCELNRAIATENARHIVAQLRTSIEMLGSRLVAAMDRILAHHEEHGNTVDHHSTHTYDPEYNYIADPESARYIESENPLVNDILGSQMDITTENLTAVAQTVVFLQENNIDSMRKFRKTYSSLTEEINSTLKDYQKDASALALAKEKLKCRETINRTKNVYDRYTEVAKKKNPIDQGVAKSFYKKHEQEIYAHQTAMKFLKNHPNKSGKMPTTRQINAEISGLEKKQKERKESFIDERIEGWDMMEIYKNLMATIGPDPDFPSWHPINTLNYQVEHDLPDELHVYGGHDIHIIQTYAHERAREVEKEREKVKTPKKEEPFL